MEGLLAVASALAAPFLDATSRTFWLALVSAAVVAAWLHRGDLPGWLRAERGRLAHRSTRLDIQLLIARQLLRLAGAMPEIALAWWLATSLVGGLDALIGNPDLSPPDWTIKLSYTVTLFLCWDFSRYVLHRLAHTVPFLWALHQVHHSAEVMTPLTFHRIHPVESLLFQLRGALVSGVVTGVFFWLFREGTSVFLLFGVHGLGLMFNVFSGNLRHSHTHWSFGPAVERWLISPAQHQLHHSIDPAEAERNFGTWLAVWDRLFGTLTIADRPVRAFGVAQRNHDDDLLSALIGPFGGIKRAAVPLLLLALPWSAEAEDTTDADEAHTYGDSDEDGDTADEGDVFDEIVVRDADGNVRAAGSAYVLDEEDLEAQEYNDIHRMLAGVPGLYTRGEDGFGLRPNIGIRGANGDRSAKVSLLEDGIPLAPAPYAAPAAYYFPMATRLTGIEVFKGPAATQHGPHTVGGAINLQTRDIPQGSVLSADVAVGERESTKVHVFAGSGDERRGVLIEATQVTSDGFKQLDGGGPTGFDRGELMAKARLAPLELKLGYAWEQSNETYLGLAAADYDDNPYRRYAASAQGLMHWKRTQAELAWPVRLSEGLTVRTVAYHHYLTRQWTKFNRFRGAVDTHRLLSEDVGGQSAVYLAILRGEEDSTTADQQLMIGTNDRRFHSFGLSSRGRWEVEGDTLGSTLEFGARYHGDIVDRVHTEVPFEMRGGTLIDADGSTETTLDSRSLAHALALHAHEDIAWRDRVHVLPGARVEVVQTARDDEAAVTRAVLLPGAAVLVELHEHIDAFAGAHRGFSPVAPGAPADTRPELAWNYEAGTRLSVPNGPHVEAVGFVNDYVNLTGQCTLSGGCSDDALDQQFNAGEVLVVGLESVAGVEMLLPRGLSLPMKLSYTWTHSSFKTGFVSGFPQFGTVSAGDRLPYIPAHQGAFELGLRHQRFGVDVATNARTGMLDAAGGKDTPATVPGRAMVDMSAHVMLGETVRLYATGTNLGGSTAIESWRPFGARPTAPRTVMVGLKGSLQP